VILSTSMETNVLNRITGWFSGNLTILGALCTMNQAPMREVVHRTFAREFNDATYTFRESDDDRAPVYTLLPTGAKANRVFVVGTLTETEDVGSEDEYWQGRIVDPMGTVFVYAGQYQPEATAMLPTSAASRPARLG
jgi:RPA family protein